MGDLEEWLMRLDAIGKRKILRFAAKSAESEEAQGPEAGRQWSSQSGVPFELQVQVAIEVDEGQRERNVCLCGRKVLLTRLPARRRVARLLLAVTRRSWRGAARGSMDKVMDIKQLNSSERYYLNAQQLHPSTLPLLSA